MTRLYFSQPVVLCATLLAGQHVLNGSVTAFGILPTGRRRTMSGVALHISLTGPPDSQEQQQQLGDVVHQEGCPCCATPTVTARTARIMAPIMSLTAGWWPPKTPASTLPQTSTFQQAVEQHFPNSLPASKVASHVHNFLVSRNFKASNTLMATSFCPDEINSKPHKSLASRLQTLLLGNQNGAFGLGGLGGLPFVGITGMKAFLSHAPRRGKVVIVFGPHVGITENGVVGKVERLGQNGSTTSCGAALGAYQAIQSGNGKKRLTVSSDFQEDFIINKLRSKLLLVPREGDNAAVQVTTQLLGIIVDMLMEELNASWKDVEFWERIEEVVLVGGIVLNRGTTSKGTPQEDYFQPQVIQSFTNPNGELKPLQRNLLSEVFDF